MQFYTYIITSPKTGRVLDMGTYYDPQCCRDTAREGRKWTKGNRFTLTKHNDDGGFGTIEAYTIQGVS